MTWPDPSPSGKASTCALCPKLCRFACPVAAATADEAATPTAMMEAWGEARRGTMEWTDASETFERCTGCGACNQPCEHGQDVRGLLFEARAEAWEAGGVAAASRSLQENCLAQGHPFEGDLHQLLTDHCPPEDFNPKGRILYWPGCRSIHAHPERLPREMALFRALGAEAVSLPARRDVPSCCGAPLRVVGDRTGFAATAAGLRQYLERQRTWVAASSDCLDAVSTGYPEVGIEVHPERLHLAEYLLFFRGRLAELGQQAREGMESKNQPLPQVLVHDACGLKRGQDRSSATHEVLSAVTGGASRPLTTRPGQGTCCGSGDFHDLRRPEAARQVSEHSLADSDTSSGSWVVTGDPGCLNGVRAALPEGTEVHDLAGFLLAWLEPVL